MFIKFSFSWQKIKKKYVQPSSTQSMTGMHFRELSKRHQVKRITTLLSLSVVKKGSDNKQNRYFQLNLNNFIF